MDIEKLIEKAVGDLDRFGHMSSPGAQAGRRAILRAAFAEVRREAIAEAVESVRLRLEGPLPSHLHEAGLHSALQTLRALLPPAAEEKEVKS